MNTLIIYASRHGSTRAAAEILAKDFGQAAAAVDIRAATPENMPNLNDYDAVIFGSPVRAGTIDKKIRKFITIHMLDLRSKTVAMFLTGMSEESAQNAYKTNFSNEFLTKCRGCTFVGGRVSLDGAKGFDKIVIKAVMKKAEGKPAADLLPDRLHELYSEIISG